MQECPSLPVELKTMENLFNLVYVYMSEELYCKI